MSNDKAAKYSKHIRGSSQNSYHLPSLHDGLANHEPTCDVDSLLVDESERREHARLNFDLEFVSLQDPNSSNGRVLYSTIQRMLMQYKLERSYQVAFILNEAYIRAVHKILLKGETIHNVVPWLRCTAQNIVRELNRSEKKYISLENDELERKAVAPLPEEVVRDDFRIIMAAFRMLNEEAQLLLNLKVLYNLSWREITEILSMEGYGHCSEATLRKRKQRAITQLRKKFHAIKPPTPPLIRH